MAVLYAIVWEMMSIWRFNEALRAWKPKTAKTRLVPRLLRPRISSTTLLDLEHVKEIQPLMMRLSSVWRTPLPSLRTGYRSCAPFSTRAPTGRFLRVSDEIKEAVHSNKPIVALETTIYTHGTSSVL